LTWKRRFDDDGFVLAEEELGSAITEGWLDPSGFNKRDTSGLSAMRSEHEGPYAAIGFKSHHRYESLHLQRKWARLLAKIKRGDLYGPDPIYRVNVVGRGREELCSNASRN
jgi:hypothetical protein